MAEFLHDYSLVPESIIDALLSASGSRAASAYAIGCPADTSDCSTDGGCSKDSGCGDIPTCSTDASDCSSDGGCSKDSPCSDSPCSDTPKRPPTASGSITISSVGATSITVQLAAISLATSYVVVWRPASQQELSGSKTTTSRTVTITGLQPETEYVINYYGKNSDGNGPYMSSGKHATTLSARPDNWEWWSMVAAGSTISLSAREWNAFCDRINEFRAYAGLSSYSSFVPVYSGDLISASIVNHAVRAIGDMNSTALNYEVKKGDTISAKLFIDLKNALNSI